MSRVLIKLKNAFYNKPMMNLLYEEATIHGEHHDQTWLRFQPYYLKTGG
jgi:hypothetical protein